jgi:hypothetical protein
MTLFDAEGPRILRDQWPYLGFDSPVLKDPPRVARDGDGLPESFGTSKWADDVFGSGLVGSGLHRSRMSHRHQMHLNGDYLPTEGYENLAACILDFLKKQGTVSRWKAQPFSWLITPDGGWKVPDFLVELQADLLLVVLQIKSKRFLTAEVDAEHQLERSLGEPRGVRHAVWTDEKPLDTAARNLFFHVRKARNVKATEEVDKLVEEVHRLGRVSALDLAHLGHDPALIPLAVSRNAVHIDFMRKLDADTLVCSTPVLDGRELLLGGWNRSTHWWDSL